MICKTLGLIGYGAFSAFVAPYLTPHFTVKAWNRSGFDKWLQPEEMTIAELEEVAACDIVVIGVTVQAFDALLPRIAPVIKDGALVLDVASVKVKPAELMLQHLPSHCDIIATHPLFGPESGRNGIAGLKCVVAPVRTTRLAEVVSFLTEKLELEVLEKSPEEHDQEMAWVQGLPHYVVRALQDLNPPSSELATPAYQHLRKVQELLCNDSEELFMTIEKENPCAAEVRRRFLKHLQEIDAAIQKSK